MSTSCKTCVHCLQRVRRHDQTRVPSSSRLSTPLALATVSALTPASLLPQYEPDFKDRIELEISVVDRLWSAGLEEAAAPYRDSATCKADWSDSSRGFMSVSALQERLDAYALSLCAQLPDVAALNERVAARRTAVELLLLLEESGFDLDLAAAAAEAGGRSLVAPPRRTAAPASTRTR